MLLLMFLIFASLEDSRKPRQALSRKTKTRRRRIYERYTKYCYAGRRRGQGRELERAEVVACKIKSSRRLSSAEKHNSILNQTSEKIDSTLQYKYTPCGAN